MGHSFPTPEEVLSGGLSSAEAEELIRSLIERLIKKFRNENRTKSVANVLRASVFLTVSETSAFQRDSELVRQARELLGPAWSLHIVPYDTYPTNERDDPGPTGAQTRVRPHASIGPA